MRKKSSISLNLGAWPQNDGIQFRVWAPYAKEIKVIFETKTQPFFLKAEKDGYFSAFIPGMTAGALYKYQIDNGQNYPDPCSRYQPQGPHGPSMVINNNYPWQDDVWQKKGLTLEGQVIYELHV